MTPKVVEFNSHHHDNKKMLIRQSSVQGLLLYLVDVRPQDKRSRVKCVVLLLALVYLFLRLYYLAAMETNTSEGTCN